MKPTPRPDKIAAMARRPEADIRKFVQMRSHRLSRLVILEAPNFVVEFEMRMLFEAMERLACQAWL